MNENASSARRKDGLTTERSGLLLLGRGKSPLSGWTDGQKRGRSELRERRGSPVTGLKDEHGTDRVFVTAVKPCYRDRPPDSAGDAQGSSTERVESALRETPGATAVTGGRTARVSRVTGSGGAGTDREPERERDRDRDRDPAGSVEPCPGWRSASRRRFSTAARAMLYPQVGTRSARGGSRCVYRCL